MVGYLLCDDLMFSSRITGTAKALGLDVKVARSPAILATMCAQETPRCIMVDVNLGGLSIGELVNSLPSDRPQLIGYGSHVDAASLKAARDAGCDVVLPRSKFVEDLASALPTWFGAH